MLLLLQYSPITTPFKPGLSEEFVRQIIVVYFIRDVGSTLAVESIRFGSGRLDVPSTITFSLDVWIVKRIDIDGKPKAMFGYFSSRTRHETEIERGGVVSTHRCLIIGRISASVRYPLDPVLCFIEPAEYPQYFICDSGVYHHLAALWQSIGIAMQYFQVTEIRSVQGTILFPLFQPHAVKNVVADFLRFEPSIQTSPVDFRFIDNHLRFPFGNMSGLRLIT